MKTMALMFVFAAASINLMQADVRTVEIAQMQRNSSTMMADDQTQAQPVLVAAR
jgi:hypothetical protein